MKSIRLAILMLTAVVAFSVAVDAKVVYRRTSGDRSSVRRRRDQEKREAERKKKARAKAVKDYKERQKKLVELRKKRIAIAEAKERESREKAQEAQQKKIKDEIAAKKTARLEQALLGKYDIMAKEVRMSTTQRQKLVNMVRGFKGLPPNTAARDSSSELDRLTKLYKTATGQKKQIIAARIKKVQKDASAPATGKSASKVPPEAQHRKIMGLLTPAQKLKWGGYTLANDPALKFEGVGLSARQVKSIRTICDAAARELPDESSDIPAIAAAKARKTVVRKVRIQCIFEVLTPAQRTAVGS